MKKPFWEETYGNKNMKTFGEPSFEIIELSEIIPEGSLVLDMGCGDGRNSGFLAEKGFNVEAFDISETGINRLKEITEEKKIKINAWVEDLVEFKFSKFYDVIITHGVLHLLEREVWAKLINEMKTYTNPGGVNIVAVFTDEIEPPEDLAPFTKGLFKEGELAELYSDWEIKLFQSYVFEDEHGEGLKHTHPVNKIVAIKNKGL